MRNACRRRWARPVPERLPHCAGRRLRVAATLAWVAFCALEGNAAGATAQTQTVVIEGFKFNPPVLTLHRGDRIVWRNKDLVPHTATSHGLFDSRSIAPGNSWTYVARKSGTLAYVCTFHPTMQASLTVQ